LIPNFRVVALAPGFLLSVPTITAAKDPLQDLSRADWSVNAPHDLAHNPPSNAAVWSFIGHLPDHDPDLGKLCDFRFVDLRHSGSLSLVVSDDAGGTADCYEVEVFDKTAAGIDEYKQRGYLATPGVEDIDGDGRFEVVVDRPDGFEEEDASHFNESGIAHCHACRECDKSWPRVYAWTGNGYTDVSSQFPKYYQRELESLKKQIAAIDAYKATLQLSQSASSGAEPAPRAFQVQGEWASTPEGLQTSQIAQGQQSPGAGPEQSDAVSPAPEVFEARYHSGELDCLTAEAAKMERFLGISKGAGMGDAIRWANSDSPSEREFAAEVLPEIGTAEALKYEQTLARDSDHDVADSAKEALKDWGQRKPEKPSAFERGSIP
jgi:hypothetical protein